MFSYRAQPILYQSISPFGPPIHTAAIQVHRSLRSLSVPVAEHDRTCGWIRLFGEHPGRGSGTGDPGPQLLVPAHSRAGPDELRLDKARVLEEIPNKDCNKERPPLQQGAATSAPAAQGHAAPAQRPGRYRTPPCPSATGDRRRPACPPGNVRGGQSALPRWKTVVRGDGGREEACARRPRPAARPRSPPCPPAPAGIAEGAATTAVPAAASRQGVPQRASSSLSLAYTVISLLSPGGGADSCDRRPFNWERVAPRGAQPTALRVRLLGCLGDAQGAPDRRFHESHPLPTATLAAATAVS